MDIGDNMGYFLNNASKFKLEPDSQTGLRACQLGAIWALKSFYTASTDAIASLISLPTGCGKTAIMMAACFELRLSKVLIIAPSKILRSQISEQFRNLKILRDVGCLNDDLCEVKVFEVKKRQTSRESWEEIISSYDVIVAHPNSVSPHFKKLSPLPNDLIDAVIVDEAHHEPAPTWQAINDYYSNIKRIFLTATPFRRDRKRMRAKLVYHYPLNRAIEDGIIRPVVFCGESAGLLGYDERLINSAIQLFNNEKKFNPSALVIIRTNEIEDAKNLHTKYNEAGMNVELIHSKRSHNVNSGIVQKAREGKLDGIICVGMASEGLDIPNLKIAVLHSSPRSVPYTIQFLGRISRQPVEQQGEAYLIANKDEIKGEVSRLYKSDKAWGRLIPGIVDEQMKKARHYRSIYATENDFQMPELNIFFSASVFETSYEFKFNEDFDKNDSYPFEIVHIEQKNEDSPIIIVTSYDKPLEWASRSIYLEGMLDVHIIYHMSEYSLLFVQTTSEMALNSFIKNLLPERIRQIPYGRLYRSLSEFDQNRYIMLGMKNAVMKGVSQPSYKTLIGNAVQASVRASDGRVFSTGHALLKLSEKETWGLAASTGRVWSMQRGTAEEFQIWCDKLAQLMSNGPIITSLPGLSFLANVNSINSIDDLPIAIIPNEYFFRAYSTIIEINGKKQYRNLIPIIEPQQIDSKTGILKCKLTIGDYRCAIYLNYNKDFIWDIKNCEEIIIRADINVEDSITKSIQDFFNELQPTLIMKDGSVIEGRNKITPNTSIEKLPNSLWEKKDWLGCNINKERFVSSPIDKEIPVINKTVDIISQHFNLNGDVLILDDGSHEIADLIWFQGLDNNLYFIHCKAASGPKPGCRKSDCDVLYAQVMRSIHWVSSYTFMDRLSERLQNNSSIILGEEDIYESIKERFQVNSWNYKIIAVQPGFNVEQVSNEARSNNNVYELTIPTYERVVATLASLEIWGS